jgi:hypothetical protein
MEFGIFIQSPVHKDRREADPGYEHKSIMNDIEVRRRVPKDVPDL